MAAPSSMGWPFRNASGWRALDTSTSIEGAAHAIPDIPLAGSGGIAGHQQPRPCTKRRWRRWRIGWWRCFGRRSIQRGRCRDNLRRTRKHDDRANEPDLTGTSNGKFGFADTRLTLAAPAANAEARLDADNEPLLDEHLQHQRHGKHEHAGRARQPHRMQHEHHGHGQQQYQRDHGRRCRAAEYRNRLTTRHQPDRRQHGVRLLANLKKQNRA